MIPLQTLSFLYCVPITNTSPPGESTDAAVEGLRAFHRRTSCRSGGEEESLTKSAQGGEEGQRAVAGDGRGLLYTSSSIIWSTC